jgi:hypothetical protein
MLDHRRKCPQTTPASQLRYSVETGRGSHRRQKLMKRMEEIAQEQGFTVQGESDEYFVIMLVFDPRRCQVIY